MTELGLIQNELVQQTKLLREILGILNESARPGQSLIERYEAQERERARKFTSGLASLTKQKDVT
jgi:hypothetical protein